MPVAYYLFIQYNSLKVVLSKKTLTVIMGVVVPSVFVWVTNLLRTSQGQACLFQLCHCIGSRVVFCAVPECYLKTWSSSTECSCQGLSLAANYSVAPPLQLRIFEEPLDPLLDRFCSMNTGRNTQIALYFKLGAKEIL